MTETKRIEVELKAGDKGEFRAVFATFGVKDLDGDVTMPGAFTDGAPVRIAQYGHNWNALPVGKGVIRSDNEKAWVDGTFFLDTQAGADTYRTVKALGDLQEYSYGFSILESERGDHEGARVRVLKKLKVHEVSPVMVGAGLGTGTESIKSASDDAERDAFLFEVEASLSQSP